jgi:hypothetical protein
MRFLNVHGNSFAVSKQNAAVQGVAVISNGCGSAELYASRPSLTWESNKGTPEIRFMPAIIRFLGYNPLPPAETLAEQLLR